MANKKPKCLTCKHPLDEHTGEHCLHWNWDIQKRCKCAETADGVLLAKIFEKKRVVEVIAVGDNFVWFKSNDGKMWRWMYKEKMLFPIDVV